MDPSPLHTDIESDVEVPFMDSGCHRIAQWIYRIIFVLDTFAMTALCIVIPSCLYYVSSFVTTYPRIYDCTVFSDQNHCSVPICVDGFNFGNIVGYAYCKDYGSLVYKQDGVVDHIHYEKNIFWLYAIVFTPLWIHALLFYLSLIVLFLLVVPSAFIISIFTSMVILYYWILSRDTAALIHFLCKLQTFVANGFKNVFDFFAYKRYQNTFFDYTSMILQVLCAIDLVIFLTMNQLRHGCNCHVWELDPTDEYTIVWNSSVKTLVHDKMIVFICIPYIGLALLMPMIRMVLTQTKFPLHKASNSSSSTFLG